MIMRERNREGKEGRAGERRKSRNRKGARGKEERAKEEEVCGGKFFFYGPAASYFCCFFFALFHLQNPQTHQITDLISFYTLPSTIIGNPNYKTLKAAYSYYNVATSVPLVQLMKDALVFAKKVCVSVNREESQERRTRERVFSV